MYVSGLAIALVVGVAHGVGLVGWFGGWLIQLGVGSGQGVWLPGNSPGLCRIELAGPFVSREAIPPQERKGVPGGVFGHPNRQIRPGGPAVRRHPELASD